MEVCIIVTLASDFVLCDSFFTGLQDWLVLLLEAVAKVQILLSYVIYTASQVSSS